jgi:hypothetical protein
VSISFSGVAMNPTGSLSRRTALASLTGAALATTAAFYYVLPSKGLIPGANGVFWPTSDDPLYRLVGNGATVPTSDHRLVWQDVRLG